MREPEVEHHGEFFDFDRRLRTEARATAATILIGGESEPRSGAPSDWATAGSAWCHTPESVTPIAQRLRAARPDGDGFTVTVSADVRSTEDVERFAEAGVDRLIVAPWRRSPEAVEGLQIFSSNL